MSGCKADLSDLHDMRRLKMNARQLIERYHNAWTTGDFVTARGCLADDLDFKGSIDTFHRADDFVAALRRFHGMLRGVTLLKGIFDEDSAALLYDCDTVTPAGVIRTAEFFSTADGRISKIQLVFDASELRKLM
jgi:ketosteroid isomerase-like protein